LQPSVASSLPPAAASPHLFIVFRGSHAAPITKIPSGVPPEPAGVVLLNTFFWKILVTRVNGKMREASRFARLAP
jgi:hypothetical protein